MVKHHKTRQDCPYNDDFPGDEIWVQTLSDIESLGSVDPNGLNTGRVISLISMTATDPHELRWIFGVPSGSVVDNLIYGQFASTYSSHGLLRL